MFTYKCKKILTSLLLIGTCVTALAQPRKDLNHKDSGFYIGAGLGLLDTRYESYGNTIFNGITYLVHDHSNHLGLGFNGSFGYQFNKYIGIESDIIYGTNLTGLGAAFKGTLPINDKYSVFGKLGYTSADALADSSGHVFGSVGVSYNVTSKFAIDLAGTQIGRSASLSTIGFHYSFKE